MGIGTSLGDYYEDGFNLEAGIPTPPKEGEGSPKKVYITGKSGTETEATMPPEGPTEVTGALKSDTGTQVPPMDIDAVRAPYGVGGSSEGGSLQGTVIKNLINSVYTLMDKALKLPGDVATGNSRLYDIDPQTGEFHTSQDAIERSADLAGMVMSGTLGGRIHLRNSPSHEVLTTDRSIPITEEQWRTIRQPLHPVEDASVPYGWDAIERDIRPPANSSRSAERLDEDMAVALSDDNFFIDKKNYLDPKKSGNVTLREYKNNTGRDFRFLFNTSGGELYPMHITIKHGGKQLYVEWIGDQEYLDMHKFGSKNVKELLYMLADRFPDAETIAGWRVSGARKKTGKGSMHAEMRLPRRRGTYPSNGGPPLDDGVQLNSGIQYDLGGPR